LVDPAIKLGDPRRRDVVRPFCMVRDGDRARRPAAISSALGSFRDPALADAAHAYLPRPAPPAELSIRVRESPPRPEGPSLG
jgi:hypothetical protein